MSAGWTPGPWEANQWGSGVGTRAADLPMDRVDGYGSDYTFICDLNDGEYHEYKDGVEQMANARLIAAAPDLYEALARIIACVDGNGDGCYDTVCGVAGINRNGDAQIKGSFIAECIRASRALVKARGEA